MNYLKNKIESDNLITDWDVLKELQIDHLFTPPNFMMSNDIMKEELNKAVVINYIVGMEMERLFGMIRKGEKKNIITIDEKSDKEMVNFSNTKAEDLISLDFTDQNLWRQLEIHHLFDTPNFDTRYCLCKLLLVNECFEQRVKQLFNVMKNFLEREVYHETDQIDQIDQIDQTIENHLFEVVDPGDGSLFGKYLAISPREAVSKAFKQMLDENINRTEFCQIIGCTLGVKDLDKSKSQSTFHNYKCLRVKLLQKILPGKIISYKYLNEIEKV